MSDDTSTASIDFTVSLDTSTTPHVLSVMGNNKVDKSGSKQSLVWKLGAGLAGGEFVAQSECKPGFEWLSWPQPPDTIFGKASRDEAKNKLVITDAHSSANSDGRWYYKLRVNLGGVIYETPMTAPEPFDVDEPCDNRKRLIVGNNPVIINR